jgi:hypothetical protein
MIRDLDCGCGGDCAGGVVVAPSVDRPAVRKATLYAGLVAFGWAFDSKWAFAIGVGGLIGAVVDLVSNERRQGG